MNSFLFCSCSSKIALNLLSDVRLVYEWRLSSRGVSLSLLCSFCMLDSRNARTVEVCLSDHQDVGRNQGSTSCNGRSSSVHRSSQLVALLLCAAAALVCLYLHLRVTPTGSISS